MIAATPRPASRPCRAAAPRRPVGTAEDPAALRGITDGRVCILCNDRACNWAHPENHAWTAGWAALESGLQKLADRKLSQTLADHKEGAGK